MYAHVILPTIYRIFEVLYSNENKIPALIVYIFILMDL
jgi:hypothetical protein